MVDEGSHAQISEKTHKNASLLTLNAHPLKMDRRLSRSPAFKSPVLSPTSPAIYEKYKSGCAWGLIHFFDFRQAHSHGKFISDKKRANRQAKVDNKNAVVNSGKPDVKNDIEDEMFRQHQTKKKRDIGELQNQQSKPELVCRSKDRRKVSKGSKKTRRFPARGCDAVTEGYRQPSDHRMVEKSSNNNLASVAEASDNDASTSNGGNHSFKNIGGRKCGHPTEINVRVEMNEAVEAFVNQKSTDGENLSRNDFIDALEVLNSNKELFMKLLQDPNSLLVKHIQDLRDCRATKKQPQSSSKAKTSKCQPKGEEDCDMPQPSNTTLVFKSGKQNCPDKLSNWPSPQSHYNLRKKAKSVRPAFLSFEHMKRKLRHAMRVSKKEHSQMSLDDIRKSLHDFKQFEDGDKEMSRQANESISASKSYQDVGKMSESRRDEIGQTGNIGTGIGSKASSSTESCHRTSNLLNLRHLNGKYHPRKHLSDMLYRGNEDFSRKQTLRTLDRLTASPTYDLLPRLTPQRDKESEFASPQMRFSPYNFSTINRYKWRAQKEKNSSCSSPSTEVLRPVYSLGDDFSRKGHQTYVCTENVVERNPAVTWDDCESNALDVALQPNAVQNTNTTQRTESLSLFGGSEYFECSKPNSPSGDPTSSSSIDVYSSSPFSQGAEISDSMSDREEQPSPISVLEQFFVEENTSSPSNVSLSGGTELTSQSCAVVLPVEPFCIDNEEHYATSLLESKLDPKNNADTSNYKQRSLSECIREVLQVSGFNWDDLSRKWHFSDQSIDTTLLDNVEACPEKSGTDRRLFFGYISEVLLEIYQCYFRCSPWISLLNTHPRRAMLSKDMVHDVLKHVDWQLLSELPQQPLQQLVENDLRKSGTWMDIRLDTEDIVTELVDSILEDLVVDASILLQT